MRGRYSQYIQYGHDNYVLLKSNRTYTMYMKYKLLGKNIKDPFIFI